MPKPFGISSDISPLKLSVIAAIGALAGFLLGAWLGTLVGASRETTELVGTVLGSFLTIAAGIGIANNQELRKYFLYSIGAAAAGDSFLQIVKKATRPSVFSLFEKDSQTGYFKRMSIYIGIGIILLLLKRSATYDKVRFRSDTETAIENYIRSVLPLAVVLLFKLKSSAKITAEVEKEEKQNSDLVLNLLPIINRSRLRESDDVDELIQELQHYGYEIKEQPTSNEVLLWAAELEERYKPFGYIEDGTPVEVERDPIIQNGEVKEKGRVRKKRSVS